MQETDERKVFVAVDADNFCILAGDPDFILRDPKRKKELQGLLADGYTLKTILFNEYKSLKWVWDKQ